MRELFAPRAISEYAYRTSGAEEVSTAPAWDWPASCPSPLKSSCTWLRMLLPETES